MAMDDKRPVLPGKLAKLPYFEFSIDYPKSHAEQKRTDVIYGVGSLGDLLRKVSFRLDGPTGKLTKF